MIHQQARMMTIPETIPAPKSGLSPTMPRMTHRIAMIARKRSIPNACLAATVLAISAMWLSTADAASQLPPGKVCLSDANGDPLGAGTVGFYIPSTLTPKNTWTSAARHV